MGNEKWEASFEETKKLMKHILDDYDWAKKNLKMKVVSYGNTMPVEYKATSCTESDYNIALDERVITFSLEFSNRKDIKVFYDMPKIWGISANTLVRDAYESMMARGLEISQELLDIINEMKGE